MYVAKLLLQHQSLHLINGVRILWRWDSGTASWQYATADSQLRNALETVLPNLSSFTELMPGEGFWVQASQSVQIATDRWSDRAADFTIVKVDGPQLPRAMMSHHFREFDDNVTILFGGHGSEFRSLSSIVTIDRATGSVTEQSMNYVHDAPVFVQLDTNGMRYLIAGGNSDLGVPAVAGAEIYDYTTRTLTPTGSLNLFRASAGASKTASGKVLVAGGWYNHNNAHTVAEIYDPATGLFTTTGSLVEPRADPIVLPANGGAVVIGGIHYTTAAPIESVEFYNESEGSFSTLSQTILPGESGWYVHGGLNRRSFESMLMRDGSGRFIFKADRAGTKEQALIVFDPATKQMSKLPIALPKSDDLYLYEVHNVGNIPNTIVLLGSEAGSYPAGQRVRIVKINLATGAVTLSNSVTLPQNYDISQASHTWLNDGTGFLIAGGTVGQGYDYNFQPVATTFYLKFQP
ncbi:MAG: hypothetical protein K6347_06680 [Campylobacterales bacterium]